MKAAILKLGLAGLCAVAPLACTADIHDNPVDISDNTVNIDDATVEVDTDTDVTQATPNQSVQLTIVTKDVYLIEPSAEPPSDKVKVAGHLQIYFDSLSNEPLLITAQTTVTVKLPADATPGDHKLICRVHKHDGTPTTATFELKVTVKASVTVDGG